MKKEDIIEIVLIFLFFAIMLFGATFLLAAMEPMRREVELTPYEAQQYYKSHRNYRDADYYICSGLTATLEF